MGSIVTYSASNQRRIPGHKYGAVVLTFLATIPSLPSVYAQKSDTGKEIARELLKVLIESQLERQGRESFQHERHIPQGKVEIPHATQATPEMTQVRRLLTSLGQDARGLSAVIVEEGQRAHELRRLTADVVQFEGIVRASLQRADRENHHLSIQPFIQSLDQAWRPLAEQITSIRGSSVTLRQTADRISQLDSQLCRILGIREAFNAREVVRAADILTADIRTLTDEIGYNSSFNVDRGRVIAGLRKLQDQATSFANLSANGGQLQTVIVEYKSVFQSWQEMRPQLEPYTAGTVSRTAGRIQETHRAIHNLLHLEFSFDQVMVQKMAETLEKQLSELYRSITLEQLMLLSDGKSIPEAADELFGTSQNLTDVVTRKESLQAVGEAWLYLHGRWELFEFYLNSVRSMEMRRRIDGVDQSIDLLQDAIGVTVTFDRRSLSQQIGSLEAFADQLQLSVKRWLARPGQQDMLLGTQVQQLSERLREMSQLLYAGRDQVSLSRKCDELILHWQQMRTSLSKCDTEEKESIEQLIDVFIPGLIRLRTMVEN